MYDICKGDLEGFVYLAILFSLTRVDDTVNTYYKGKLMGNLQNSSKLILVQWWPRGWRNEYLSHPWGLQIKESWPQPALWLFSVVEPYSGGIQNIHIFFFKVLAPNFPDHIPPGELHMLTNDILATSWRQKHRDHFVRLSLTNIWFAGCWDVLGLFFWPSTEGIPRYIQGK